MYQFLKKYYVVIGLSLGAITAFILPGILTQQTIFSNWNFLDWHFTDKTGAVGDTIGGISGPILNFIGLILIYLSFQQQSKSLLEDKARFEKGRNADLIMKLIEHFKSEVEEAPDIGTLFVHTVPKTDCQFSKILSDNKSIEQIGVIIGIAAYLKIKIEEENISENDRNIMKSLFVFTCSSKLSKKVAPLRALREKCKNCGKKHYDEFNSKELFELIENMYNKLDLK